MDASPAITEASGYNQGSPVQDTDEEEDLCRICRSPEEPGNPLRHPCACRGSIKYVHQDCIRLWLNRRRYKNCEVCGRSYSFVRVYSENAPEQLPCHEFLLGLVLRVLRYVNMIVPWIVVILLNTYFTCLLPWGQEVVVVLQRDYEMSWKFASLWAGLFYSFWIVCFMTITTVIWVFAGDLIARRFNDWFSFVGSGLGQRVIAAVVHVLWKYMDILFYWYSYKLVQFFHLREHWGLVNADLNAPLDEFGALRKMLSFLDANAFGALAISIYVSALFVLLPFSVGWIVIATVGGDYLLGNSHVFLGYMMMLSISFAYLVILFTLNQISFPARVGWFSLGLHFITVKCPCLMWVKAYRNLSVIKGALVLHLKLGVLPWFIGCWLETLTSPMFGTTISRRFEIFYQFPSPMSLQWWTGFMCLVIASFSMDRIQEILLAILFHLPFQAITFISPSFFPLELWITNEKPTIGAYAVSFFLMASSSPWLFSLILPASELIVRNWIITVSSWLHLSDFLLVVPHHDEPLDDNPFLCMLYAIIEGPMVSMYNREDNIEDQGDNRFKPRIALMLVLAALSMFLFSTAFMTLPVLVGRAFFDSISFITLRFGLKHDDLCAFLIGCYILRRVYINTCFVFDHIHKGRTNFLIKYILVGIRNCLLFSIWIFVIPGLLGLLIDLMMIIPSRVPLDESPFYFFLIEDWLTGLVVLHIWTFMTMLTPINCFATEAWRGKFERIRNVGINSLPLMWLLQDVIGSIINTLLTTLCIPYLLKSLFPLVGFSQSVNLATERFIWPALLALVVVWFMAKLTRDLMVYLHQLIFDDLYVVGERVADLTEGLAQG